MIYSSIHYDEPVFRPPAEAYSAILQVTIGCSWNRCAFCEMYTSKKFRIRTFEDIQKDIHTLVRFPQRIRKVFLADGNAFVLSTDRLLPLLKEINIHLPRLQRISSYALPGDILSKSPDELKVIREHGLKLLYIGIESGDDRLLQRIQKSESFSTTREGILKAHEAGIETSIMVINGLGGRNHYQEHAIESARLINQVQPKFLSTLTLSLPFGQAHYERRFDGEYIPMTVIELAEELKLFLEHLRLEGSIFRSDHISNNLVLKGRLDADKEQLIEQISEAIQHMVPGQYPAEPRIL